LVDLAKNREAALKGIGDLHVWKYSAATISKQMHDWAFKAGFEWGEISSHSNRGGKNSFDLFFCIKIIQLCL
jgi:hypothetical protein